MKMHVITKATDFRVYSCFSCMDNYTVMQLSYNIDIFQFYGILNLATSTSKMVTKS